MSVTSIRFAFLSRKYKYFFKCWILGVRAWVDCTSKLSRQISQHLLSLDSLTRHFDKYVEADGFPANMRCVAQHSSNSTSANECISKHSDRLQTYLNHVSEQVDAKYQAGTEFTDSLDQCQSTFVSTTKAQMANIIHNLMTRIPQLNIHYDSQPWAGETRKLWIIEIYSFISIILSVKVYKIKSTLIFIVLVIS